jgi:hypothetical protein
MVIFLSGGNDFEEIVLFAGTCAVADRLRGRTYF